MNPEDPQSSTNSPEITSDLNAKVRAITSKEQALAIANKLESDQSARNNIEAIVDRKFNGDLPFNPATLKANEESWRYNFSTQFMAGIVTKIIPAPVSMIDSSRYLTSASLCGYDKDNKEAIKKTQAFREKITKAIRSWSGWKSFQYALWTEDVLHGNAIAACLDPYSPWPDLFRTDQAFLPIGTKQHARNVPVVALKKDYLLHEFVDGIRNRSEAEHSGWVIGACVNTINDSLPQIPRSSQTVQQSREYEDAVREGNPGASFSGAKVVQTWHVLAVEPDTKKVTHYILDRNGKNEILFQKDDQFESMEDLLTLFTLEPGNGHFYGPRGVGRILLNMHLAIEASRCYLFDNLRIGGLSILHTDAQKTPTMEINVRHPFLVLSADGTIEQQQISLNVADFKEADDLMLRWAEQATGSYISGLHGDEGGAHPTATEEQIRAQREQQFKIAYLARAWSQHADLVFMIQKRLIDPETSDKIAKDLQKELMEVDGFTRAELKEIAESPSGEPLTDLTSQYNDRVLAAYQIFKDDPDIDQRKLKDMVAAATVDSEFAREVVLDDQMLQTNEIEGFRQQLMENADIVNSAMSTGVPDSIPVSPRDPHEIHIKTGLSEIKRGIPNIVQSPNPKMMDAMHVTLRHLEGHVATWEQQGAPKDATKQYTDAIAVFDKALQQIAKTPQKAPQSPANGPVGASGMPGGMGVAPTPQQPDPIHPEEHLLKIASTMNYRDVPESIKRQIEAMAGFQPADTQQALKEKAQTAIENHPDLPVKVKTTAPAAALPDHINPMNPAIANQPPMVPENNS
jgi:hypothetical protein